MKGDGVPRIEYTTLFNKQRKAAPLEIKEAFLETLRLFLTDLFHPALRNHALHGTLAGYRSIDVTEDYRAVFAKPSQEDKRSSSFTCSAPIRNSIEGQKPLPN